MKTVRFMALAAVTLLATEQVATAGFLSSAWNTAKRACNYVKDNASTPCFCLSGALGFSSVVAMLKMQALVDTAQKRAYINSNNPSVNASSAFLKDLRPSINYLILGSGLGLAALGLYIGGSLLLQPSQQKNNSENKKIE